MRATRTILAVIFMSVLLVLYIALAGYEAWLLIADGQPLALIYGVALMIVPAFGVWSLVRELLFGRDAARLVKRYEAEIGEIRLPVVDRRDSAAVDALVTAPPATDWRDALIHGLTLDTVGRRREGRASVRRAIQLAR